MNIRLPLKLKLSVIYSLLAVLTFMSVNYFFFKYVDKITMTNAKIELDLIAQKANQTVCDYIIKEKELSHKKEGSYLLTPHSYSKDKQAKIITCEFKTIPKDSMNHIFNNLRYPTTDFFIEIYNENMKVIWESCNTPKDGLPKLLSRKKLLSLSTDSLQLYVETRNKKLNKYIYSSKLTGASGEFVFARKNKYYINGKEVFYYFKRFNSTIITIATTTRYGNFHINQYEKIFYTITPIFWIVSLLIGIIFLKYTLKPIDKITIAAKKITVDNLHDRLPLINSNDELGRLTETLNDMLNRIDLSFTEIKRFTSDVSHELKTPLTILRGELEIALNTREDKRDYIYTIASSLDEVIRLQNVVESLLELSRADIGNATIHTTKKSLTKLMVETMEDATILAESEGLAVYSKIQSHINFIFDPVRIHQVIINLVDNAIKYNVAHGSISIELKSERDNAIITIADTGMGMQEEELKHIFDRFYRVEKSRSKRGVGLGLSFVDWIVKAHKGEIRVRSTAGEGTEFMIVLPMNHPDIIDDSV